mmetsp:Transcript_13044/g.55598  ORF Transcript_13044/g.55598 Transcript_13044/m.55598 type:complete len:256 (-) Transcript_13044:2227-2994(-)
MFSARFSEIFSAISASAASSAFSSSCVSALSSCSRMSKSLVRIKLVFRIAARRSMEMISASCSSGRGGELTTPVGAPKPASAGSAVKPSATTETTDEAAAAAKRRETKPKPFSFSSRRESASEHGKRDSPRARDATRCRRVDADCARGAETRTTGWTFPGASACADFSGACRRATFLRPSTPTASRTTRRARSRARALASVVSSSDTSSISKRVRSREPITCFTGGVARASRARARRTCDASRETGYRLPASHAF